MTKIAFVLSPGFRDDEYFNTIPPLAAFVHDVFSNHPGNVTGADGRTVHAKFIDDLSAVDYDGVVFVGGPGVYKLIYAGGLDLEKFISVAKEFLSAKKLVAAICIAPIILAKSGILRGRKATVWDDGKETQINTLIGCGAEYVNDPVVQSGNIITAFDRSAAAQFGGKIKRYFEHGASQ